MTTTSSDQIASLLQEGRSFPPPQSFAAHAHVDVAKFKADRLDDARQDPEAYWAAAADHLVWRSRWNQVLEWNPPRSKWFVGGTLNVTDSCLDRHVASWRRTK